MHKHFRVFILLLILLVVAVGSWATKMRVTDWNHTLRVVIYPINADQSNAAESYIQALDDNHFEPIKTFFSEELESYELSTEEPIQIALAPEVRELPPQLGEKPGILDIMLWSLKLRYWAFQRDEYEGPKPEIQLFALYYDPVITPKVKHSTGLDKGHVAIINLFAKENQVGSNLFVIVHELLHTLGATDKYHSFTQQPLFPVGYAEPDLQPLYPQNFAEVMGGRIPLNEQDSEIPKSLSEVVIGYQTAREIRLIE